MEKRRILTGRILSLLAVLFLLFDVTIHILNFSFVKQSAAQLGYDPNIMPVLGAIELICIILYVVPRTSVLGAVLLTGYLGGAVATNVRVGTPLFTNILFPIYVAIFLWGGLYLTDHRVRVAIGRKGE